MDYSQAQEIIRKYVQKVNLEALQLPFLKKKIVAEKAKVRELFPRLEEHDFEALIEKLWEDGVITRDDGHTLTFEEAFARVDFDRYF